jgi:hypothetical protein
MPSSPRSYNPPLTPVVSCKPLPISHCVSLDYSDLLVHFVSQHVPCGEDPIYLDRDLDLDLESGDLPLSLRGEGLLRLSKGIKVKVD